VAAALFWAGYSLLVRYQAASESSHTIVVYLLIFSTPFNAMLALPEWQWPSETQWLLVAPPAYCRHWPRCPSPAPTAWPRPPSCNL
jgi:drug/metabolite transporter (DMT)-like permease